MNAALFWPHDVIAHYCDEHVIDDAEFSTELAALMLELEAFGKNHCGTWSEYSLMELHGLLGTALAVGKMTGKKNEITAHSVDVNGNCNMGCC